MSTNTNGFYELLTREYKLDISEEKFQNLINVLNHYDIEPGTVSILVEDSPEAFINEVHPFKMIKCTRTHTNIELDEVLFSLNTVPYGFTETFEINVPRHANWKKDAKDPKVSEMNQNLALVRNLKISVRDENAIQESFYIVIYNKKLNVIAGIRFESIEGEE